VVVHTVPLRVKDAGDGYAPSWLPTNPMLTVLPLFGAVRATWTERGSAKWCHRLEPP